MQGTSRSAPLTDQIQTKKKRRKKKEKKKKAFCIDTERTKEMKTAHNNYNKMGHFSSAVSHRQG